MCMMCEEDFMYRAYLDYLAGKAQAGTLSDEEKAFLAANGLEPSAFVCDPVPEMDTVPKGSQFSRMGPKAS